MLTVYWFCFLVGGVFVLLAVLGGLDDADLDMHFDIDTHVPIDSDVELTDPGDRSPATTRRTRAVNSRRFLFNMLKSLKFWTFGLCFFGLTGLVLSQLLLPPLVVSITAIGMGILCGAMVSGALQALRGRQVDSLVRTSDLVGLAGTVELPFNSTNRGKVRLLVKGTIVSAIAYSDEVREFQPGDQVLVVGTEQNRLWVVSADSFHNRQPPSSQTPSQQSDVST